MNHRASSDFLLIFWVFAGLWILTAARRVFGGWRVFERALACEVLDDAVTVRLHTREFDLIALFVELIFAVGHFPGVCMYVCMHVCM